MANATQTIEVEMCPKARCELPMKKIEPVDPFAEDNPFDITLTITEEFQEEGFSTQGPFDYLSLEVTIGVDSPRLKAYELYTQYATMSGIIITHGSKFWETGYLIYQFFPTWDNDQDRIVVDGQTVVNFEYPVDFQSGHGLKAHSIVADVSIDGTLEVGMAQGYDSKSPNAQDQIGTKDEIDLRTPGAIIVKLSEPRTISPGSDSEECAISPRNPLYETTWTFKEYNPIPFGVYMLNYYYADKTLPMVIRKGSLIGQLWNPSWLKAGEITANGVIVSGGFWHTIRVITSGDSGGWIAEEMSAFPSMLQYSVGQWVIMSKTPDDRWVILPSSKLYYTNAVKWLR